MPSYDQTCRGSSLEPRTGAAFVIALLVTQAAPVRAAAVVGDGSAASCTSKALADSITTGSGTITFACGAAPVSIVITQPGGPVIPIRLSE